MNGAVRRMLVVVLPLLMPAGSAAGRIHARETASSLPDKPTVAVPRVPRRPTLEDFLDMRPSADLDGKMALVRGGFLQREPVDGDPASQHTDVYLGYDDLHLYAIFVAFDTHPDAIRAHMARRETFFGDDIVHLQLDTFRDERRAYTFICNPLGVQFDAIWTEGSEFDDSFDTVWESRGRLTDRGYVVWMEIPFKSLRFPVVPEQTWGMILNRDIPRNNEESFWPGYTNRIQGRLNQAGLVTGLRDISPGQNMQFIPYATTRSFRIADPFDPTGVAEDVVRNDIEAGLDAKFVFRDSLVLDVTANPDFSQVESDEPQVIVNQRFEVFFPEKRPFFLENATYFQTPINLLFTRRIKDPSAGLRLTGKSGPWAIGVLGIDDRAPGEIALFGDPLFGESARNGVLRANRDIFEQSTVGVIYTERRLGDGRNRVGGIDGRIKWDDHWNTVFQLAASDTRTQDGLEASDDAYDFSVNRTGRHFNWHVHYLDFGPAFRTELGFVPRTDLREFHQDVGFTFRPEGRRLLNWTPELHSIRSEDHDGTRLDRRTSLSLELEYRWQTELEFGFMRGNEQLRPEDFPVLPEARDYPVHEQEIWFRSEFSEQVNIGAGLVSGRGIKFVPPEGEEPSSARVFGSEIELTLRPATRVRIDATWLLNRLRDYDRNSWVFTDEILRLKLSVQVDPKTSLRFIVENEDLDTAYTVPEDLEPFEALSGEFLFTYLVNPWTAVYAGYNSDWRDPLPGTDLVFGDLRQRAKQFFVKLSYLFRR